MFGFENFLSILQEMAAKRRYCMISKIKKNVVNPEESSSSFSIKLGVRLIIETDMSEIKT